MSENELSKIIVNKSFEIHKGLGPGLLESVYEDILSYELRKSGLMVSRQQALPVIWKGIKMEQGFKADLIVENKILIELKSVDTLAPVFYKQVLTYLKITNIKLGLLFNFNEPLLRDGIKRIVNGL
ncbi:GxxExxY protein [Belliella kenyensis]|uniref:GxxExxY protein n=1 Tax=Belliella kenyensis TaxID=1472724 RepID=A0ABV8EQ33_9BACT|nr:GxxExxY protein [Belliella kenyensis]MCH7402111.1 GxxExxY protein [Belliella kenyensis]MDN3601553.1 GxxExxY protein [Belliella kenyensis]